mmetsp:Transcript_9788/g.15088  ORF Transcript_9788/g.15088 Transcript_9788/m.15088 type:complete len:206 (+) Transcript_9788:506-1123(+)
MIIAEVRCDGSESRGKKLALEKSVSHKKLDAPIILVLRVAGQEVVEGLVHQNAPRCKLGNVPGQQATIVMVRRGQHAGRTLQRPERQKVAPTHEPGDLVACLDVGGVAVVHPAGMDMLAIHLNARGSLLLVIAEMAFASIVERAGNVHNLQFVDGGQNVLFKHVFRVERALFHLVCEKEKHALGFHKLLALQVHHQRLDGEGVVD